KVGGTDTAGFRTGGRGVGVVPDGTTYRENRMALEVKAMADDGDIDDAVTRVVPTEGALVLARFNARVGARALVTLNRTGKTLPFGAPVTGNARHCEAIVAGCRVVHLSGVLALPFPSVGRGKPPAS
ncbi:fimbria/pilus outer membrane usher protein, partial [Salmonella enterica]|uniref:fimbria/pilus outer membrane usher protein n=1 Tax=Salmonella enterica TaxID=28901 RepID=UPI00398C724C